PRYLQLPKVATSSRNLAVQITRGKATEYDKALALQNYLRNPPFVYSTNTTLSHSERAIEEFLFNTKKGYCEQFSGSYAVLARSIGLPTRIAVGFTAGSAEGDTFKVLNEHAHAWPEVFFPNVGWVAFEPTPGRAPPGVPATRRRLRDRRRAAAVSPSARVLVYWQEANDVLAHAGAGRRPHETFGEHARRAAPQARLEGDVSSALLGLAGDATAANYGA